jgi:hypothetical protein
MHKTEACHTPRNAVAPYDATEYEITYHSSHSVNVVRTAIWWLSTVQDEGEGPSREKLNQKKSECVRYLEYGVLTNADE